MQRNGAGPVSRMRKLPAELNVRRGVLYFSFALAVITYLDLVCISAAAPLIMQDLGLSVVQMSIVFSSFALAYSLFEVPTGWMGDVVGPRRVLTRIVLWWSGFTMLTGGAWNYLSLVLIRFLFGAGEAGAFPNAARSFSRWFPPEERGKAHGILFLGSRLGGAVAPALALLLIRHWGWRESFVLFGSIGIVWAVAWYRWYRDEPSEHRAVSSQELALIRGNFPETIKRKARVPWKRVITSRNL